MSDFTFFHAADLHLGTPFQGIGAAAGDYPQVAEKLRQAPFAAFDALLEQALAEHPAFLVIAGDLFEARDRSVRAELHLHSGLGRLAEAGTQCFVVHGNHDPVESGRLRLAWPEGVHLFGAEEAQTAIARNADGREVATVTGISYRDRRESRKLHDWLRRARRDAATREELFHLALLHCNVDGTTGHAPYVPCTVAELTRADFDYWALGHVHTQAILHQAPWVAYPGCIQGRHARETGARGFLRVRVAETTGNGAGRGGRWRVEPEFVACDVLRWVALKVSLDEVATVDEVEQALAEALENAAAETPDRPLIARLELRGRTPLAVELQRREVQEELLRRGRQAGMRHQPFIWLEELRSGCRPPVDLEERRRAPDLLGQILEITAALREDPEAAAEALRTATNPLFGHTLLRRELEFPDAAEQARLLAAAELRCIDLLEEEPGTEEGESRR